MSGDNIILDTNIIIDYLDEQPDRLTVVNGIPKISIPAVVVGELYVGVYRSLPQLKQDKADKIERFIETAVILSVNKDVSILYAQIKAALFKKGKPIPENGIWIAATTLNYNLPLYTLDAHFREIDSLQLFNPLSAT